ncbi:BrnA antitoxin family protein [Candidatus Acetothermia bacterium]|nr:BrnA antitoxin family protein [Candidatus Acetothermia bacterium]MCI2432084.1 BrnA antitoxin family protein [Candidatus Acetothermia bacterium]MCI2435891.1 BrnA antitoxin family protein [Candidatus Acetothermia bacterium]
MTKAQPLRKKKLPDFEKMSPEEIADFWEKHDSADYWDQMEDVTEHVIFKRPASKTVSVRIAEEELRQLKRLAAEHGLGYTTLIRSWIKEKLHELETTSQVQAKTEVKA